VARRNDLRPNDLRPKAPRRKTILRLGSLVGLLQEFQRGSALEPVMFCVIKNINATTRNLYVLLVVRDATRGTTSR
jgi:hypothetical protein